MPRADKQGTQPDAEGEIGGLFELAAVEVCAGVVAAVGCIEDDDKPWCAGAGIGCCAGGGVSNRQCKNQ